MKCVVCGNRIRKNEAHSYVIEYRKDGTWWRRRRACHSCERTKLLNWVDRVQLNAGVER